MTDKEMVLTLLQKVNENRRPPLLIAEHAGDEEPGESSDYSYITVSSEDGYRTVFDFQGDVIDDISVEKQGRSGLWG